MPHDTDAECIDWFYRNESYFAQLQQIAVQEAAIGEVAKDFCRDLTGTAHNYPDAPSGFSRERWDLYRDYFKKLRFDAGISIQGPNSRWLPNSVMMTADTAGISISGSQKGYLWSSTVPGPLVESLDPPLPPEGGKPWKYMAFKAIKPRWYLYLWSA